MIRFSLLLPFKKLLRTPVFWLLCLMLVLLPAPARRAGEESHLPRAGLALCGTPSPSAKRAADWLTEVGFQSYADEAALRRALFAGEVEAGVLIPGELDALLAAHHPEQALTLLSTPSALLLPLWREDAAAALCSVYAPYLTADALAETEIPQQEIFDAYYALLDGGARFSFLTEAVDGPADAVSKRGENLALACLSLLLFAAAYFSLMQPLWQDFRALSGRIGRKNALFRVFLPGLLLRGALLWLCAAIGGARAGLSLWLPLAAYLPAVLAAQATICLFFSGWERAGSPSSHLALTGSEAAGILVLLLLLAGLILCPVFTDLSVLLPGIRTLRRFFVPYFLWPLAGA